MVTDEERDYMFAEYAKDPRMKRHMGIGRRLAPLLDNDRRMAELLHALLLLAARAARSSTTGTRSLMGDNIYLGDRDSVRTPMQWSPDRNGGFSAADFAQLYLPPLMDPVYGYRRVNVEAQLRNQGSFLHWLRRMLNERRGLPVMGVGEMEVLPCANPSVLAYVRSGEVADVLSPAGSATGPSVAAAESAVDWGHSAVLTRTVPAGNEAAGDVAVRRDQAVLCVHNLSRFAQPAELALAKWSGHALRGARSRALPGHHRGAVRRHPAALRVLVVRPRPRREAGLGVSAERDRGLARADRGVAAVAPRCAGAKAAPVTVLRADVLQEGRPGLLDVVARVGDRARSDSPTSSWASAPSGEEPHLLRSGDDCVLGLLDDESGLAVCTDALRDAQLAPLLLATVRRVAPRPGPVTVVCDDEDTTVLDCGDRGDLVVFPWLSDAPRPDVDMLMALEAAGFNHVAAPLVRWTWDGRDLGVVQEPLADRSVGWALALTSLRDLYASRGAPEAAGGDFGAEAQALGTMTARMHLALDRAFLRQTEPVSDWVDGAEAVIAAADRSCSDAPGVADLLKWIREADARLPGDPDPRRLPPRADGADRSGVGGQRLPARRGEPAGGEPACARRWPTWPTSCGRCTRRASWRRPSGTRPGVSASSRSVRPGRRGTGGRSWPATWAPPGSRAWSGPIEPRGAPVSFLEFARSVRRVGRRR